MIGRYIVDLTEKLVKILADDYRIVKEQLHKYALCYYHYDYYLTIIRRKQGDYR